MEVMSLLPTIIFSVGVLGLVCLFLHLYNTIWLKSERVRKKLRVQGIRGPPPSILYGNLPEMQKIQLNTKPSKSNHDIVAHDYTSTLFPYFEQWRKEYGTFILPYLTNYFYNFFFLLRSISYSHQSEHI